MSDTERKRLIDQVMRDAEANPDADDQPGTVITRGDSRSKTLQVRLNPAEYDQLQALGKAHGVPASTYARHLLLPALESTGDQDEIIRQINMLLGQLKTAS
jgi:hypothetical protein